MKKTAIILLLILTLIPFKVNAASNKNSNKNQDILQHINFDDIEEEILKRNPTVKMNENTLASCGQIWTCLRIMQRMLKMHWMVLIITRTLKDNWRLKYKDWNRKRRNLQPLWCLILSFFPSLNPNTIL